MQTLIKKERERGLHSWRGEEKDGKKYHSEMFSLEFRLSSRENWLMTVIMTIVLMMLMMIVG